MVTGRSLKFNRDLETTLENITPRVGSLIGHYDWHTEETRRAEQKKGRPTGKTNHQANRDKGITLEM